MSLLAILNWIFMQISGHTEPKDYKKYLQKNYYIKNTHTTL